MPHRQSPAHTHAAECERRLAALGPLLDELAAEIGAALVFAEIGETMLIPRNIMPERERVRLQTLASLTSDHITDAQRVLERMKGALRGQLGA